MKVSMFRRTVSAFVSLALVSGCAVTPRINPVSPATIALIHAETNRCGEGDQAACERAKVARDVAYIEAHGAPAAEPEPSLGLATLGVAAVAAAAVIDAQQPRYMVVRRCRYWC